MNFWLRRLVVLSAFTTVSTAVGRAQPEIIVPAPPVVPKVIPKQPIIDPAAKALIEATTARYQAMNSYSDVTTLSGFAGNFEAKISWQKPSKARVEAKLAKGISFGLNDGANLWALNPRHPGYYLKRAANQSRIFDAIGESDVGAPGFMLMIEDKGFENFLRDGLYKLEMGLPEEFDGKPMQTVRAHFAFDDGKDSMATFFIGKEDGLLYQVRQNYDATASIVEMHRDIKVNPELGAETWQWTPPTDLKPVEYFSSISPEIPLLYKVGQKLPLLSSTDLAGQPFTMADLKAKVTIIHFLAARMGRGDLFELKMLQDRVGADKLKVICVSMDGRREKVQEFTKENDVSFPILFDGKGWLNDIAVKLGVRRLPTSLLVDQNEVLAAVVSRPSDPILTEKVQALLQ
jgi:peroxiredoxin